MKKIIIICDSFYPKINSAAIQMRDLAVGLSKKYQVDVLTYGKKSSDYRDLNYSNNKITINYCNFINYQKKNLRGFVELVGPILIYIKFKSLFGNVNYIIWYSPSIFLSLTIFLVKRKFNVKVILILRDIFPQWALDLGIIKNGLIFNFLKKIEYMQYKYSDIIAVQSEGNLSFIPSEFMHKATVLENWLVENPSINFSLKKNKTNKDQILKLVYAGNLGPGQDLKLFKYLLDNFNNDQRFEFHLFISGIYSKELSLEIRSKLSRNFHLHGLVDDEILALEIMNYDYGIISLNNLHRTHNIPGKFLYYLRSGLCVMGYGNHNNDISKLIEEYDVGAYASSYKSFSLNLVKAHEEKMHGKQNGGNCLKLFHCRYSLKRALNRINYYIDSSI
jgi:hypothetical protein